MLNYDKTLLNEFLENALTELETGADDIGYVSVFMDARIREDISKGISSLNGRAHYALAAQQEKIYSMLGYKSEAIQQYH